jgi:ABC-type nitrate/sulfonate/bicarbonate transport system substrate-binding protein
MRLNALTRKASLALAGFALLAVAAARAEPVKIRVGWVNVPGQITPILFDTPGIAKHLGKSYALEPIRYTGSSVALTALAAGELELANLTFTQVPTAIINGGLTDLRILVDEFRDGVAGYDTIQYMVLQDGPIKRVEDLKGKVVAVNAIGAGTDIFMRVMLRKNGLEYPRDYTIIEAPFPTMKAMLGEKKADLIIGVKPFTEDPTFKSIARTLFTQVEAVGPIDMVFLTARESWIKKNRAAIVDFFEDFITATRWYTNPANHQQAIANVSRFTKIPSANLQWAFTKQDFYRDPNLRPDLDSIQRGVNLLKEFGFIKASVDVPKFADLSLVDEAAGRLK